MLMPFDLRVEGTPQVGCVGEGTEEATSPLADRRRLLASAARCYRLFAAQIFYTQTQRATGQSTD